MTARLVRYQPASGLQILLEPSPGTLDFIHFGILNLRAGQSFHYVRPGQEAVLVLLAGKVRLSGSGKQWTASRRDVFHDSASSVLVPGGAELDIVAESEAELALAAAESKQNGQRGEVRFFGPETIHVRHVGRDNWTRDVKTLVDLDAPAQVLIVGETVNPEGNWSSYPPHRHDYNRPPEEIDMEEVYFYRFDPPNGFGLQRIYTADRKIDQTFSIEQNTALPIREGFHPVVAAAGYKLYYLWVLAGKKRELIPYTDPEHAWLLERRHDEDT